MSPHALDKTGTRHTDTQWKAKGGEGREQKPLDAPHIMLLLPATLINKPYSPEHEEFHACASILTPLTSRLQTLLVVYLVKHRLTSFRSLPITGEDVRRETKREPVVCQVLGMATQGGVNSHLTALEPFCSCREISVLGGCLIWIIRIIVPP